jgi:hypothetical protein
MDQYNANIIIITMAFNNNQSLNQSRFEKILDDVLNIT